MADDWGNPKTWRRNTVIPLGEPIFEEKMGCSAAQWIQRLVTEGKQREAEARRNARRLLIQFGEAASPLP